MRSIVTDRPHLSLDLMHVMTSYIQEIQTRYRELATEHVEQRVAIALLRLASQIGELRENTNSIDLSFSRQDLAEMTGTTLYTVSRLLSEWERAGVIESGRERVRILKAHELVRIADGLKP
jgi:CRP-like cAMP-binding protein